MIERDLKRFAATATAFGLLENLCLRFGDVSSDGRHARMDVGHEFRDLHHGGSLVGAERFRCHCPESLNRDSATRVCASCRRYVRCCIPRQARRILMSSHQHSTTDLPITGKLTIHFAYAMAILVLLLTASVAGVLYSRTVYPVDDLRRMFLPNDVVNLSIGLPFLTVSLLLIW